MDEVSTDIQTQARDLAKATNPTLSENTLDRLGTIAGQQGARLMDGQVKMSEAYDPGSQIAESAIADLKKGEAAPGIERNFSIVSVTARFCKL